MTVNELIKKLQALPNGESEVLVNVKVRTQVYGQAQVTPWDVDQSYNGATISVTLPEGYAIKKNKKG
jgi:hypothetical protein